MSGSRREFLFNGAAVLAANAISRPLSAAAATDDRLEKLFDSLFERLLEISPQLAVTLGRDSGSLAQSRMQLAFWLFLVLLLVSTTLSSFWHRQKAAD